MRPSSRGSAFTADPECTLLAVSTVSAPGAAHPVAGPVDVARSTVITVGIGETLIQFGLTPVVAVIPGLTSALGVGAADAAWILTVFILARPARCSCAAVSAT